MLLNSLPYLLPILLHSTLVKCDDAPTGYLLRNGTSFTNAPFDNNNDADSNCHEIPDGITVLAVEAHNVCVSLYSQPNCQGPFLYASSTSGACDAVVPGMSGNSFGGPGCDVPDWVVKSYIANVGLGAMSPGTLLVPAARMDADEQKTFKEQEATGKVDCSAGGSGQGSSSRLRRFLRRGA